MKHWIHSPTPVLFGKVGGTVGIPVTGGLVGFGSAKNGEKMQYGRGIRAEGCTIVFYWSFNIIVIQI